VYTIPDEEETHAAAVDKVDVVNEENEDTTTMDEDFGDFDDDLLDAAEDIMTKAASQHSFNSRNTGQDSHISPKPPANIPEQEEGDPYSDDFGDFDFDAAELAATQSASTGRTGSSHPHVRTAVRR
jgi:DNA replication ATP-dependent helicase Dna2